MRCGFHSFYSYPILAQVQAITTKPPFHYLRTQNVPMHGHTCTTFGPQKHWCQRVKMYLPLPLNLKARGLAAQRGGMHYIRSSHAFD